MFKYMILIALSTVFSIQVLGSDIKFEKYYFLPKAKDILSTEHCEIVKQLENKYINEYKKKQEKVSAYDTLLKHNIHLINFYNETYRLYPSKGTVFKNKKIYGIDETRSSAEYSRYYIAKDNSEALNIFKDSMNNNSVLPYESTLEGYQINESIYFFKNNNSLYALVEGERHPHNKESVLYVIDEDGGKNIVTKFKLVNSTDDFHLMRSFLKEADIILKDTTRYASHEKRGKSRFESSINRPWIIVGEDVYGNDWRYTYNKKSKKFLELWGLQDALTYRKYKSFQYHKDAAEYELTNHYINKYGLSRNQALKLASSNINNIIGGYLSIVYDFKIDENRIKEKSDLFYKNNINWDNDLYFKKNSYLPSEFDITDKQTGSLVMDSIESLKSFLDFDKSKDEVTPFNKTLLMYASHLNNYDAVKILIDNNASVNAVTSKKRYEYNFLNRLNRSALTYAVENASIEVIQLLITNGADTNIKDSEGNELSFYLQKNPYFSMEDKKLGIVDLVNKYEKQGKLFQPSFDCTKAQSNNEKEICSDKTLSIYDRELTRAYKQLKAVSNDVYHVQSQKAWFKQRNDTCNLQDKVKNSVCLKQMIRSRTKYLIQLTEHYNSQK